MTYSLTPVGGGEEVIYLGVGSGYPLCVGGSSRSSPSGDVAAWWCRLHQRHSFLLRQVLHLDRQQGKVGDGTHPHLLVPIQYMLLLQSGGILTNPSTSS
jgi:hypothetical protein